MGFFLPFSLPTTWATILVRAGVLPILLLRQSRLKIRLPPPGATTSRKRNGTFTVRPSPSRLPFHSASLSARSSVKVTLYSKIPRRAAVLFPPTLPQSSTSSDPPFFLPPFPPLFQNLQPDPPETPHGHHGFPNNGSTSFPPLPGSAREITTWSGSPILDVHDFFLPSFIATQQRPPSPSFPSAPPAPEKVQHFQFRKPPSIPPPSFPPPLPASGATKARTGTEGPARLFPFLFPPLSVHAAGETTAPVTPISGASACPSPPPL